MASIEEKVEEQYKSILDDLGIRHYGKTEKLTLISAMLLKMQIVNQVARETIILTSNYS